MYVSSADTYTIRQKAILKMKYLQEHRLKNFLKTGSARPVELVWNTSKRKLDQPCDNHPILRLFGSDCL